ncbi:MAG: 2-oxo acid dehydrogenase subunit E2, partial [Bacillota bacterium]
SQIAGYIETEGEPEATVEVPYTELRLRMASHLWQSSITSVAVTTWMDIDATRLLALRERWHPYFEAAEQAPLGLMPFFVRAAVRALKTVPELSALILPDRMVYPRRTAVGVVVAVDGGVRIARLADADTKTFGQIARELHQTTEAARSGTLPWDADAEPVFTISSTGADGPLFSSPMLPVPAAGILGLDAITMRPMVVSGRVEARPGLYASLTFDHRAVDGQQAGRFLRVLKQALEDADFEWEGLTLPHLSAWGT